MTGDRIDFSSLEPDSERWREGVRATLRRVDEVLQRRSRETALSLIVRWRRVVLAAAAVVVAVVIPTEWLLERRERSAGQVHTLVRFANQALHGDAGPTGAELRHLASPGGR